MIRFPLFIKKIMIGIYLGAFTAKHENYKIVYQDINGKRDIGGDMLDIDLTKYDFIIATPPCNYWSRANYRRETSEYAQKTKHLLGDIIDKLIRLNKPFIVENVRNKNLFIKNGLYNKNCLIYEHGRHTYWTNIQFDIKDIPQVQDYYKQNKRATKLYGYGWYITPNGIPTRTAGQKKTNLNNNIQGGSNVHNVIERWLEKINERLSK